MDSSSYPFLYIIFQCLLVLKNDLTQCMAPQYKLLNGSLPLPSLAGTGTVPWLSLSHSASYIWTD